MNDAKDANLERKNIQYDGLSHLLTAFVNILNDVKSM